MTTHRTKLEAQEKSENINRDKGFKISFPTYLGGSVCSMYGLSIGWYVQNKESKLFY